jgi:hypothetical protein
VVPLTIFLFLFSFVGKKGEDLPFFSRRRMIYMQIATHSWPRGGKMDGQTYYIYTAYTRYIRKAQTDIFWWFWFLSIVCFFLRTRLFFLFLPTKETNESNEDNKTKALRAFSLYRRFFRFKKIPAPPTKDPQLSRLLALPHVV